MTALAWDQTGERVYQTALDRGVLYTHDGQVAVWNGLTSVEDTSTSTLKSFYYDNVKYFDNLVPGDFSGKLKCFTYPDIFELVNGVSQVGGLQLYNQPFMGFDLSYRTGKGNDIEGLDYGYKLHILYNLVANPDSVVTETVKDTSTPIEFSWTLSGTPPAISNFRPTSHVSIDSNVAGPANMNAVESALYGTSTSDPQLLSISDLLGIFQ
jgi:hypothetical protein